MDWLTRVSEAEWLEAFVSQLEQLAGRLVDALVSLLQQLAGRLVDAVKTGLTKISHEPSNIEVE